MMNNFITKEEYQEFFDTDSVTRQIDLVVKFDSRLDDVLTKAFEACGKNRHVKFWYDGVRYERDEVKIEEGEYFPDEIGMWGGIPIEWLFSDNFIDEI